MQPLIKSFDLANEHWFEEGCYIVEMYNSNDDPELSIARARVKPGATTQLHCLENTIERYVILEGQGVVEVGTTSAHKVQAGDVVIIPPLCPQRIINTGVNDLIFLAICTPRFDTESYQELKQAIS